MYSLGAICALPLVPLVNDRLGRRTAVLFGSVLMVIGAALQASAVNCKLHIHHYLPTLLTIARF
jgi:MFS family permease